jgi:hypothetical protein
MNCYDSITKCAATGENIAIKFPELEFADARDYLGPGTSWEQRRAFDWGFLSRRFPEMQDYCMRRVQLLKEGVRDAL